MVASRGENGRSLLEEEQSVSSPPCLLSFLSFSVFPLSGLSSVWASPGAFSLWCLERVTVNYILPPDAWS